VTLHRPSLAPALLGLALAGCATAAAPDVAPAPTATAATPGTLPRRFDPRPTSPAISPTDLMSRVYVFADDSMLGREAGTEGSRRANAYIAAELQRLGLQPAGENGTYYQDVPMVQRGVGPQASLVVDGQPLVRGRDWLGIPGLAATLPFGGAARGELAVIYGGRAGDVASYPSAEQVRGKLVVLAAAAGPNGQPTGNFWSQGQLQRFRGAAAVAVASLELLPPPLRPYFEEPQTMLATGAPEPGTPFGMAITMDAAERLLGAAPATLRPGAAGRTATADLAFTDTPTATPARNVVAIVPGSDPALRGQYVAIGSHADHVGLTPEPVDHDSLRAFNTVLRPRGADGEAPANPTAAQLAEVRRVLDSLRAVNPRKVDSVFNGADDDASGSMGMLEIVEALMAMPTKPRRSTLFVWHTAEEKGLFGSEWYGANPTVPRDSIVAQVNIDMIGRGGASDIVNGGPGYVAVVGASRLSRDFGTLVNEVNRRQATPLAFDAAWDRDGHPQNIYCRSDHYHYARHGIPVVFLFTGLHGDYHQVTDEPQYINYPNYARITSYVHDLVLAAAERPTRFALSVPKPDPNGTCQQ
jgi:hypothetical protein